MKKILLITGVSAISLAAFAADVQDPVKLDDAFIQKLSPNGKYAVSNITPDDLRIFNLETGEVFSYSRESEYSEEQYYFGIGQCISNNGIFVGGQTDASAEYWKNGEWHLLNTAGRNSFSNSANAISNDGSRICGMVGCNYTEGDDTLMVIPCIWNAEGDGYGEPILLPYPKYDIAGRVPMFVKAIDISGDGKIVIGEIKDARGAFSYPIIYKEDEEGNWSYEIPHEDLIMPEGFELPEYPGEFKENQPSYEDYMTPQQSQAYNDAVTDYYNLNDWTLPFPELADYMTPENADEYAKAMAEYDEKYAAWEEKWMAYVEAYDEITDHAPSYQENSVRISNDGLTYGCTIAKGGGFWSMTPATYHVWVFDMNSDNIVKYDQKDDLCLTYLANGGIGVSSTPVSSYSPSNSNILKDGEVTGMYEWMNSTVPAYGSWMKENMEFEYIGYDEETWDPVLVKEFITGHATSTPDLSVMALSVNNIGFPEDEDAWDDPEFNPIVGYGYIYNMKAGTSVETLRPATEEKTIYDLSGRKLKNASAPGIYIINGEKKVIK